MRLLSKGLVLGAFVFIVAAHGAAAEGQGGAQRTDPQAGSPAGVIYQIPLDSGRRDAAPVLPVGRRRGDTAGSTSITGGPGSGDGSGSTGSATGGSGSTRASGLEPATRASGSGGSGATSIGAAAGGAATAGTIAGGGTASDPSSIHSENGFGSSSQVPGLSAAAARTGAGVASAHAAGSAFPSYLLVLLIAGAAVAVGLMTSRTMASSRRASQPTAE